MLNRARPHNHKSSPPIFLLVKQAPELLSFLGASRSAGRMQAEHIALNRRPAPQP